MSKDFPDSNGFKRKDLQTDIVVRSNTVLVVSVT